FISAVQFAYNVSVFDPGLVNQDRPGADPDRLLVAEITGEARHRARGRPLAEEEEARCPNCARWPGAGPTCWPRWPASSRAPARASRTSRWPGPRRGCAGWPGAVPTPYRA